MEQMTLAATIQAGLTGSVIGPPRLIREDSVPTAECPSCGARMSLGSEGATWAIRGPGDIGDRLLLQLGSLEREELHVLLLNTKNVVMAQERVYVGNVSASLVRVAELFTEAVEQAAWQVGVEEVSSVRIRWIGHQLEAETHIVVDCDLTTMRSHEIAEGVRHGIFHAVPKISDVTVHVDPCTHAVADPHRTTRPHLPNTPRGAGASPALPGDLHTH